MRDEKQNGLTSRTFDRDIYRAINPGMAALTEEIEARRGNKADRLAEIVAQRSEPLTLQFLGHDQRGLAKFRKIEGGQEATYRMTQATARWWHGDDYSTLTEPFIFSSDIETYKTGHIHTDYEADDALRTGEPRPRTNSDRDR